MALWKISETAPFTYRDCTSYPCTAAQLNYRRAAGTDIFCKDARLYSERFALEWNTSVGACHFYYLPAADQFQLFYTLENCWWGAIAPVPLYHLMFSVDPVSGAASREWGVPSVLLVGWRIGLIKGIEVGSYGKLYCTSQVLLGDRLFELDIITYTHVSGGWYKLYADLPGFSTYFPIGYIVPPYHSLVNREDGIIMLNANGSPEMHFWNIAATPHVYLGKMTAPGAVADVCYEDRHRCWIITRNGYVQKINYQLLRTELLSELQDKEPTDINYLIAWDQKRFRLAVFRHKPDAADGSCTSTIEFYRPLPKIALLTDPVPIKPLRYGQHIPFSFHLVGTAGEGISPYMVEADLVPPVDGYLERASMGTGQYGVGGVEYVAPDKTCVETLQLKATYTDGDAP